MHEPWILCVADDLTGALEVGAKFSQQGLAARVAHVSVARAPSAPVFVIHTATRHLCPSDAAATVRMAAARMAQYDPWLVYKKTDSTLRGNIAAELGALADAFPERGIIYAPAYPAMGRTVRGGQLFVDGVPVHRTAFAADPLNPIRGSSVQSVLGDIRATILDGESDEDILAVARQVAVSGGGLIVAGPAAIGGAMAGTLPLPRQSPPARPVFQRCLVVNGSLHPASKAQIGSAMQQGLFDDRFSLFEYDGDECGVERAARAGERVRALLRQWPADALVVFGGDTVDGIHQAFGAPDFICCGEVLPGVPLAQCAGLHWVTKAGGFGGAGLLGDLRRTLLV